MLTGALFFAGYSLGSDGQQETSLDPGREVIASEGDASELYQQRSIDFAQSVVGILRDDASQTTEEYLGNRVSNKSPERPGNVPETTVGYEYDELYDAYFLNFSAVSADYIDGVQYGGFDGEGEEISGFDSIKIRFKVDHENPINDIHRQITFEDINAALESPDSLSLHTLTTAWYDEESGRQMGSQIRRDVDGSWLAGVNEAGRFMGEIDSQAIESKVPRALQITGAVIQDMQRDIGQ